MRSRVFDKPTIGWVLYDWANSAFSTTVMAGFFPIFFKQYWNVGVEATVSTFRLGVTNSSASLLVALLAPLLGAVADAGGSRRRFLLTFAALGVAMTATLFVIPRGAWPLACGVYLVAILGFSGANVFYDSLLVTVAPRARADLVSAVGFAFGYLGGGLLFAVNVWMTLAPARFGLDGPDTAVRVSFVTVAAWWAVFSLPLARWVRERPAARAGSSWRRGLGELRQTLAHVRELRWVFVFLLAYWFYIDGVHTIVRMAVDYGLSLGFETRDLVAALLVVQFVGFPSSLVFGRLADRHGPRPLLFAGIAAYVAISAWGYRMAHVWEFYALAAAIGLVQGGVTSLSRSYFSRLVPAERAAQFFGFYNTVGRFSAVLGPILMGWVGYATGNPRASMFAVMALFVLGGALLRAVPETAAAEQT
ncbi:MAG: MFS transporter [Candidatus Krumholzibacteria bacterium]|nr:MFS transporter [Candidatus Krumholzibacteria bacterium]